MNYTFIKMNKQNGVVLVVSLVFLIALTAVASTLMLNTTADVKMSGASEDKVVATEEAVSAMDEVIYRQVNPATGGSNAFALPIVKFKDGNIDLKAALIKTKKNVTTVGVGLPNNKYVIEIPCPHMSQASSVQTLSCNILRVQLDKTYGRKNTSIVQVESGVAQPLLR
ncbi:PilX N-terminal domain-containing pilus assembly protein [Litorilituus lipolyticus]|uniref:Type 4 fimbrial biogenesis protein PilX N-terminal domain-containing protein n=1 Tax=Litorilituus lipolyticus TaxID=2491017 RepID=A0A502L830_9GAMM|nr:PilX N-terminal domain-containing pilus assembly protein [Litorilituus lipolyticus]TPH19234.1 hypothetical protein EPA86_00460 [Litorilituus lipolyticus]